MKQTDTRYLALEREALSFSKENKHYIASRKILAIAPQVFSQRNIQMTVQPNVDHISSIILSEVMGLDRRMLPVIFASNRIVGNLSQFHEGLALPRPVFRPHSVSLVELDSAIDRSIYDGNIAQKPKSKL